MMTAYERAVVQHLYTWYEFCCSEYFTDPHKPAAQEDVEIAALRYLAYMEDLEKRYNHK